MSPEQIVRSLCANIKARDIQAIAPLIAEHIVFMNVGLEVYHGKQAVLDHFTADDGVWAQFPELTDSRIKHPAVTGNVVLTERVDVLIKNGLRSALPLMGIFEIEHGKIAHWRDYSDMAMVRRLLAGETVTESEGFPIGTETV